MQLMKTEDAQPRGGQLDRQRQSVEAATDRSDQRTGLGVDPEVRPNVLSTLGE